MNSPDSFESEPIGLHPESGLFHTEHMPPPADPTVHAIREKQLAGEPLTIAESMRGGRDTTFTDFGDFTTKPDHAYRTVDQQALDAYDKAGAIVGQGENDEFMEGLNNKGVDWVLGAVALKYGEVIIEMPASPDHFTPALDGGTHLTKDPVPRHMKSSGTANPAPLEHATVYIKDASGNYQVRE